MFLERNLQALVKADARHEELIKQLKNVSSLGDDDYEFYETEDGHFTIKYKGVFIHDPEQPIQEAIDVFEQQILPAFDHVHLVFGIGLGYGIEQLLKRSEGKITVYEPDMPFLRFILENIDLSMHFDTGRVWMAAHQMDLLQMISTRIYGDHRLDAYVLRSYAYLMHEQIPDLMKRILEVGGNFVQDFNTGKHFHHKWLEQFLINCPYFAEYDNIDELVGLFPEKPAIVISRGPSLDADLQSIKQLRDSAVLIAVGGALRHLWKADITPDFALFYDANGMKEQLHGLPEEFLSKITFLLSPFTSPCCYEAPAAHKLVFLGQNNGVFARFLDRAFNQDSYRIDGGGTVSLIGFQVAQAMGCNPIVLAGQDLAFPEDKVYAGGTMVKQDAQGRIALDKTDELYTAPTKMATVQGQNGETLRTFAAFLSYIRHFEELAEKNKRRDKPLQLFNTSLGGAKIDGYTLKNMAEFIGEWPQFRESGEALFSPQHHLDYASRREALRNCLKELQSSITHVKRIIDQTRFPEKGSIWKNKADYEVARVALPTLYQFLRGNDFLEYVTLYELLAYKREFSKAGGDLNAKRLEIHLPSMRSFFNNTKELLSDKLSYWVNDAVNTLEVQLEDSLNLH